MTFVDHRSVSRDKKDDQRTTREREREREEDRWDSQDDSDYQYTDWASI